MRSIKTKLFELNIFDSVTANYKLHAHENICICTISTGEMLFFHDGQDVLLTPGKIIIFNINQPHLLKEYKNISKYHILHIYAKSHIDLKLLEDSSTCKDFSKFCKRVLDGKKSDFIDRFLDTYGTKEYDFVKKSSLDTVKIYIDENIDKNISLKTIANKIKLNRSYLSRRFKKEFGLCVSRYLFNRRVHLSKEMLDRGEDITQIALELGFCDQAHFYKAFKSIFAITPNEYKNIKRVKSLSDCSH